MGHRSIGLIAAILLIGGTGTASFAQQPASTPVERGKYLVTVMDCHGCHTPFKMGQPDMTRMLIGHPQEIKITAAPSLPPGGSAGAAAILISWGWPISIRVMSGCPILNGV